MNEKKWITSEKFDDIFLIINSAFIGWITESMIASYFAQSDEYEIELLVFFKNCPSALERKIVSEEIMTTIIDQISEYGIKKVNYQEIQLESTIGNFKEDGGMWLNQYWPVFQKYEPMIYDLED